MKGLVRDAKVDDAQAICEIYNPVVRQTTISFEEQEVGVEEMKSRIERISHSHTWIVYEVDGEVLGYAYASQWRGRPAYRYSVESAIYISDGLQGKGVGRLLYESLISRLKESGFKLIVGVVAGENPRSELLHEAMGFEKVGTFKNAGFKFGHWIDVTFYQKSLL
ncbi:MULTISPECIES: GNAT family N-acetyltransferase [unclassified Fusibacter]|uniref:GNAT family N-acetyltransferase n=1 Tax=unclassified Fusibacter TaxID=2624464 RepID=UPI001010C7DD|nr:MULTISPECIES: GNAT family N-acetyltransferase [unclassified Fusibacter]MCK8060537.1 N-acetyltransferase family protein [Fusibacter sp. A2]NPE23009.1 N-acetyltransferase [Fusibacter sp. A1]RXV60074.1 N-acetyltransferase [Fusibacter sp. A1]